MKRSLVAVGLVLVVFSADLCAQRRQNPRGGTRWAPDGRHLIVEGEWIDPAKWEVVEPKADARETPKPGIRQLFKAALDSLGTEIPTAAMRTSSGRGSTLPRAPEPRPGMRVSDDGSAAALVFNGDLWSFQKGRKAKRIADDLHGIRRFEMGPKGSSVSYIKDTNLYVTRLGSEKTHQLSKDGGETLFYGELDWVYQEEVYGRYNFKATWWAPDDEYLAFMRIDEKGVDTFTVVDHIPQRLSLEHLKYPKSGTVNPRATLHAARAEDGKRVPIDLSKYKPEDEILIVRVGWTPEGDDLVFMVQDREQTWLDLCFANPGTGKSRTIIHESCDDGWVNRLPMPHWLEDGTFIWESERTGFNHLYRYDRKGKLLATMTKGEWQVGGIVRIDEQRKHVTFYGTKDGAVGRNAYRVGFDGKEISRLTKGRGSHRISLNADGTLLVDSFSSMVNPGEEWVRGADGKGVKQTVKPRKVAESKCPQLHRIRARDGEWLDVAVRKPTNFDPEKAYPIWINTYSGPDSPSVRDSWRGTRGSADRISFQVNVRTASGRGMKYTKQCYRRLGQQELWDLEDAVKWLAKEPWADGDRVGISGGSYGGFMAAYALTHSKLFKVGIASSGVFDWKLYDTIYTERYMAKPQNNPEGYDISSVVKAARNLHGHLLIVHGTMDDNVHVQNAIQLIHALQEARKDFDFMVYPKSRHGIRSRHLGILRNKFIKEHL